MVTYMCYKCYYCGEKSSFKNIIYLLIDSHDLGLPEFCPLSAQRILHYENTPVQIYWKFHHQKTQDFSDKNSDIFHISAQNIDCGYSLEPPRRGGSNGYPQSLFWAEIRKIMYTPVNPSFIIQRWGLRGSKLYRYVFVMLIRQGGWQTDLSINSGIY